MTGPRLAALHVPSRSDAPNDADPQATKPGPLTVLADMREGVGYMGRHTWLWVSTLAFGLASPAFVGPWVVALPRLVHDMYQAGPSLFGLLLTARAMGAVMTTLLVGQFLAPRARGLLAYGSLVGANLGLLVLGLPLARLGQPFVPILACAAFGSGLAMYNLIWATLAQELVPLNRLGRVMTVDYWGSTTLQPVGYAGAGVVADHAGPAWAIALGGASGAIIGGSPILVPSVRALR